ncbi:hypothetical protein KR51_00032630 [Rubidibacter lacunae KORDI 51-2]|uniref:Biotin carboxylase n=1 Tax=Rubidibacter lacunae KORDI 51-2 TaxID=582515 RepID=U5DFD8_9CHRO|nr:hypothetical protein [Rubidibacter lacunae]ERN40316.1 hypothetical protein KR51_00032630 [Rubidibacter lacunae KORDI 51-2]
MRYRVLATLAIAACFWLSGLLPAAALTQIRLFDLSYTDCPAEFDNMVTSGGSSRAATCYLIEGKADNHSGKYVYDADVYGRVYDAKGNPTMQNRTRLGSIEEVPPGVSDFTLRITVPASQELPLQLKQFKASGFSAKVRRAFLN